MMNMKLLLLFEASVLFTLLKIKASPTEVTWDFDMGLEGWANATREEMQLAVSFSGGDLRGQVTGDTPCFDSPPFALDIVGRHYIVMRMQYSISEVTHGRWMLRSGAEPTPPELDDFKHIRYTPRGPMMPVASLSQGSNISAAVDENPYTMWTAPGPNVSSAFITFDLGGYYFIENVQIQVPTDNSSPRTVRLEKAFSWNGKYVPVYNFTVASNILTPQLFTGVASWGQFWRVHFVDNYGAENVSVREISLQGPDPTFQKVDFELKPDGGYHVYYIPIYKVFTGTLTRMRLYPAVNSGGHAPNFGQTFRIDWIRIVQAPTVHMVTGCIDQYFADVNMLEPEASIQLATTQINNFLLTRRTLYGSPPTLPYAKTYNCLQGGGEVIRLRGINFGDALPDIFIGNSACTQVVCSTVNFDCTCQLPSNQGGLQPVTLVNSMYLGLVEVVNYLLYQVPPPQIDMPTLSNIGAHSIDVSWVAPEPMWAAMTTTGYVVSWLELGPNDEWFDNGTTYNWQSVVVGNVTTTTLVGLHSNTSMIFQISPIAENQTDPEWTQLDLYGRRNLLYGAQVGFPSSPTNTTATLNYDFSFVVFNANATLNHSSADKRLSLGPIGVVGGEGHYGLTLVGDAQVENCNTSSTCCDGYNRTLGPSSCFSSGGFSCSAVFRGLTSGEGDMPSSISGTVTSKVFESYANLNKEFPPVNSICGPSLRLTPSSANRIGAAWYPRLMNVREGFQTSFLFRISNPSLRCTYMNDVYTHCRARGADGFAFVIQQQSPEALGQGGNGLGYQGIWNSLSIEFDTYHNPDLLEPYENHVSVQTKGWRDNNSANHSYSLAESTILGDLTDGTHQVKIVYRPAFNTSVLFDRSFQPTAYGGNFLDNAQFPYGGLPDWGTGIGTLSIFFDDMVIPILVLPLSLSSTLNLYQGRAWVGFTASTGDDTWQVHDILNWQFEMLREDPPYYPAVVINDVGAFS